MENSVSAMRKEQAALNFDRLMEARRHLDEATARETAGTETAWLRHVRTAARQLFQVIDEHQGLSEEEGGMLVDATAEKPGLMPSRERLEYEHADMLHRLAEVEVEVQRQLASEDFYVELVRLQSQVVRDILLLHLARTNSLLFEAYIRVEGGEGG